MKMLYRYSQSAFPYQNLIDENKQRSRNDPEYELLDTGIFSGNRFFDVTVEYAKDDPEDLLIQVTATNIGPDDAEFHILPTVWFRNTWSWGYESGPMADVPQRPMLKAAGEHHAGSSISIWHPAAGNYTLWVEENPELLFTENETNLERLYNIANLSPFVKDAFHSHVVEKAITSRCF
jgi:hypothetical protein